MNIFNILSNGKGRINEENFSSFLAYFLDPRNKHDIQYGLLESFLNVVDPGLGTMVRANRDNTAVTCTVDLEETFSRVLEDGKENSRTVDIVIRIYNTAFVNQQLTKQLLQVIAIENKIQSGASQEKQFIEEFKCVKEHFSTTNPKISMVFLTPYPQGAGANKLIDEYDELKDEDLLGEHKKRWLCWCCPEDVKSISDITIEDKTIEHIITDILKLESVGMISPIADYEKQTLKAFLNHLRERLGEPEDSIARQQIVDVDDQRYKIVQYKSKTIKVWIDGEDQSDNKRNKEGLRKFIEATGLDVDEKLKNSNGKKKNTRALGNDVLNALDSLALND